MKRFKHHIFILLLLLTQTSCSTASKVKKVVATSNKSYYRGLSLLKEGDHKNALENFRVSCTKGALHSCLIIGKNVIDDVLSQLSILQGATTSRDTHLNIVLNTEDYEADGLVFYVWDISKNTMITNFTVKDHRFEGSKFVVKKLHIKGLDAKKKKKYRLDVLYKNRSLLDSRVFSNFLSSGNKVRFSLASCMNDQGRYKDIGTEIWPELIAKKPELIFLIGDNVYADVIDNKYVGGQTKPDQLWLRYAQTRFALPIFSMKSLLPIYSSWDDHDYGMNNGGVEYEYKDESRRVFETFFSNESSKKLIKGVGTSYFVSLRSQNFFFLDNRSFRENNKKKDGYHLGKAQTTWLLSLLSKFKDPNWLIMGDQFFGGYHKYESFEGSHPQKFTSLLNEIKIKQKLVAFISGDRHLSEIMQVPKNNLGYKTYEITSSPIHSKVYKDSLGDNPRRVTGLDNEYNYAIVESENIDGALMVNVKKYLPGNVLKIEENLKVKKQ